MKLRFHMSEAQAANFPDWADRVYADEVPGDVQLVYGELVSDEGTVAHYAEDGPFAGYWMATDGNPYSDVAISA